MNCAEVRERLAAYRERPEEACDDVSVRRHLSACSGCRTDLAHFQELGLRLGALAREPMEPPPWLLPTLIEAVSSRVRSGRARRRRAAHHADPRVALAGGALLVAGVAGLVAIRARRRRRHTLRRKLRTGLAHA